MTDRFTDRLSEFIDGDLSPAEEAAVQEHLQACELCRSTVAQLRLVVHEARNLEDREPAVDLWPAIRSRLGTDQVQVIPLASHREDRRQSRFSFTLPQLAAAGIILMLLSGASVWLVTGGVQRPAASSPLAANAAPAAPGTGATSLVRLESGADAGYDAAVRELQHTLEANRSRLDPTTIEVVQRSLAIIDRAIADARSALAHDPADPYLRRHLDNTMHKKIDILRRAVGSIPRAAT